MAYENLLYAVKDRIARITFNRPNVLNALNRKTVEELGECLTAARFDDSVRVVILTGAGEKFRFVRSGNHSPLGDVGKTFDCRDQRICARRRV